MSQALRKIGGTVAKGSGKVVATVDPLAVVTEVIKHLETRQEEKTKREHIWAKRDAIVTELNNEKEVVLSYFEHRFAERKGALEQFYSLLHRAVDTGNDQQLETALNGILGIIQENPLKDFAEFRKNMADPNFVLEV